MRRTSTRAATKKKVAKTKAAGKPKANKTDSHTTKKKAVGKRWVKNVKTVSTFPPKELFTKDAQAIARGLASKKVSPKGVGSGIRMLQYFINRGGKGLSAARKRELEKAKQILHEKLENQQKSKTPTSQQKKSS